MFFKNFTELFPEMLLISFLEFWFNGILIINLVFDFFGFEFEPFALISNVHFQLQPTK